jgi:hypothetical protein
MNVEFTPVPAPKQDAIKKPGRAAWFEALLDSGMLQMNSRPTLSQGQKATLEEQGQRFRSRVIDGKTYVWVEDIPARDLKEAQEQDYAEAGEPDGDIVFPDDDEVPV